jgi:hypothetical protein
MSPNIFLLIKQGKKPVCQHTWKDTDFGRKWNATSVQVYMKNLT